VASASFCFSFSFSSSAKKPSGCVKIAIENCHL
jgi:hypothetical protein